MVSTKTITFIEVTFLKVIIEYLPSDFIKMIIFYLQTEKSIQLMKLKN